MYILSVPVLYTPVPDSQYTSFKIPVQIYVNHHSQKLACLLNKIQEEVSSGVNDQV
jgi:hypothetical protein